MQTEKINNQIIFDTLTAHYAMTPEFLQDLEALGREEILAKYHRSSLEIFQVVVNQLSSKKTLVGRVQVMGLYLRVLRLLG